MSATPEDVIAGRARWCVVHAPWEAVLPGLPDGAVAHTIMDPPYEAEAHTDARRQRVAGEVVPLQIGFDPMDETGRTAVSAQTVRLTLGWVLAFCQVEAVAAWRTSLSAAGARWVRGQAWVKPDGAPQFTGDRPAQGFECIATARARDGRMSWNGGGRRGVYEHCVGVFGGGRNDHPTTKPLPLMIELVELFTDPDEVVLDPFAGSGTTGVACLRLGRRCILIEKDARYAALARERMEAEEKGLTLRDARAGQLPLLSLT